MDMEDQIRAVGILNDLQMMDEENQDRVLDMLSPESKENIIRVILRRSANTSGTLNACWTPVSARSNQGEDAVMTNENDEGGRSGRGGEPIEVIVIDSDSEDDDDEEDDEDDSEGDSPVFSANSEDIPPVEISPKALPMYIRVHNQEDNNGWTPIESLPDHVRIELMRRFDEIWSSSESRMAKYATCTNNPEKAAAKPYCIRKLVVRGNHGIAPGLMYMKGGERQKAADDHCIRAGHPCAHFKEHEGEWVIRFVPLPKALRKGWQWTDLGYWVC